MSIVFGYKNKLDSVTSITENNSQLGWGTSYLFDGDINSAFRGTTTVTGTTFILFNFGSAVYMDSVACVTNLTSNGTLWLTAGTNSINIAETFGIPVDGHGTSYKYFWDLFQTDPPQPYQYWKIWMKGATEIGQHQINEIFLGKITTISEMPSYPFENNIEENTVDLVSERGQKYIYTNYQRKYWIINFEGVGAVTENALYKMYKYCRKNTQPFWMNFFSDTDPLNTKFVRFKDNAFLSEEVTKNIFDITMELEEEI